MKKRVVVVAALMAGLCFMGGGYSRPAFAGHWELVPHDTIPPDFDRESQAYIDWQEEQQKRFDGQTEYGYISKPGGTDHIVTNNWDEYPDMELDGYWFNNTSNTLSNSYMLYGVGPGIVHSFYYSDGSIRQKFKWVRNTINGQPDPNDAPPSTLWVKLIVNGFSMISGHYYDYDDLSASINIDGEDVEFDTQTNISNLDPSALYITKNANYHYPKLYAINTNGNDEVWTPPIDIFISSDSYQIPSSGISYEESGDVNYTAIPDNRRIWLTRPGAIGEIIKGNTTYGHSRFSNKYYDGILTHTNNVMEQYVRHIDGDWGYDGEWEWTPTGYDETAIDSTQTNELGSMEKDSYGRWYGSPTTPRVQTTTYTLRDPNDNAVGTATYELILHDEWENLRDDTATPPTFQEAYFPPGPSNTSDVHWVENAHGPGTLTGTWTTSQSVTQEFGSGFSVGLTGADIINLGYSFTASYSNTFGTEFGSESPPIPVGKHCYPYVRLTWYRNYYLVDHYIPAGQHRNPARLNANGEIDGTHDGSWEGWVDDYQGGHSVGWSIMYDINDFDGDGLPD